MSNNNTTGLYKDEFTAYTPSVFKMPNFVGDCEVVKDTNGEIWFKGISICQMLGYAATRNAIHYHCNPKDIKYMNVKSSAQNLCGTPMSDNYAQTHLQGGNPNVLMINENGVFDLIRGSRKPEAKVFNEWVNYVLKQMRQDGVAFGDQITVVEINDDEIRQLYRKQREENSKKQQELEELKKKEQKTQKEIEHQNAVIAQSMRYGRETLMNAYSNMLALNNLAYNHMLLQHQYAMMNEYNNDLIQDMAKENNIQGIHLNNMNQNNDYKDRQIRSYQHQLNENKKMIDDLYSRIEKLESMINQKE